MDRIIAAPDALRPWGHGISPHDGDLRRGPRNMLRGRRSARAGQSLRRHESAKEALNEPVGTGLIVADIPGTISCHPHLGLYAEPAAKERGRELGATSSSAA
jgi:hypothetical protein